MLILSALACAGVDASQMRARGLILSALACAGVDAFGYYLPDHDTVVDTGGSDCSLETVSMCMNGELESCVWNSATQQCETDSCSYNIDEASCPSSYYGSACFWVWSSDWTHQFCTSTDPCSSGIEGMCNYLEGAIHGLEVCAWNSATQQCETDSCSYNIDEASCPSSYYGSGCFWTNTGDMTSFHCTSTDPCSSNTEVSCITTESCAWSSATQECVTDSCSYYTDQASCPSDGCFWATSTDDPASGDCTSTDPCSSIIPNAEYQCVMTTSCAWNSATQQCETDSCSSYTDQASCSSDGCFWATSIDYGQPGDCTSTDPCLSAGYTDESQCDAEHSCVWNSATQQCETDSCSSYTDQASCSSEACFWGSSMMFPGCESGCCTTEDPCASDWNIDQMMCQSTDSCEWTGPTMTGPGMGPGGSYGGNYGDDGDDDGSDCDPTTENCCETSDCSYHFDQSTCESDGCYWRFGMMGYEVCSAWDYEMP